MIERNFLRQLQQQMPVRPPVQTGIGDDGAVLDCSGQTQQIVVTDMLLDRVHFDLTTDSARLVGRKAVAVNLSDLAAMACWPTAAFVSIAVPKSLANASDFLTELYDGMTELADRYHFTIAGGDTNSWDGPFAINVCLTGVPFAANATLRSGATPGDALLVTGALGGSLASRRHLTFEPALETSKWLMENLTVHAMLDISDGLSIDLHRMLEASQVGAILEADAIPVHPDLTAREPGANLLNRALSDGEDFELLLAVPQTSLRTPERILLAAGRPLHRIGTVTNDATERQLRFKDGTMQPLVESGWQHRC
ncbi:MAG: thiamine-phosphate kinase [Planctomycetaceae bacterium]